MAIVVNLDMMMAKRKMSLTELSERVDITPANLSILKTGKAKAILYAFLRLMRYAKSLIANLGIYLNTRRIEN